MTITRTLSDIDRQLRGYRDGYATGHPPSVRRFPDVSPWYPDDPADRVAYRTGFGYGIAAGIASEHPDGMTGGGYVPGGYRHGYRDAYTQQPNAGCSDGYEQGYRDGTTDRKQSAVIPPETR